MSKEFTYFEAMEEIIKDKSKKFKFNNGNRIMYYDLKRRSIRIAMDKHILTPSISDYWYKTKWTLIEEKKTYNVRVYDVKSNKLIESTNATMTEDEINKYCNSKVKLKVESVKVFDTYTVPIVTECITSVKCEEIVTS